MNNEPTLIQRFFPLAILFCCGLIYSQESSELVASSEENHVLILEPSYTTSRSNLSFERRYHYLVARAYFKLLSEAQKSERKLRTEYEKFALKKEKLSRKDNHNFQLKLKNAQKKYEAHSKMLSGLRSWNLFSENRTGDMFYFMAENEGRIYNMYEGKLPEDKMVKYLIYKLADLYHLDENK